MNRISCRRLFLVVLASLMVVSLASTMTAAEKTWVVKMASEHPRSNPACRAIWEKFVALASEKTNGRVTVEFFDGGQLGREADILQACQMGTIPMLELGNFLQNIEPRLGIFNLPFLFKDHDEAYAILDGPIGVELEAALPSKGIRHLAYTENGFRHIASRYPIYSMEDNRKIRLRVPEIPVYIGVMRALGFSVVTIPYAEAYTAIKTGVADGIEIPFSLIYSSKIYEVCKYLAIVKHIWDPFHIVASEKWWQSLPKDVQNGIMEAAKETAIYERKLAREDEASLLGVLQEQGMVVTRPDLEPFRKAAATYWQEYVKDKPWAPDLIKRIEQALGR